MPPTQPETIQPQTRGVNRALSATVLALAGVFFLTNAVFAAAFAGRVYPRVSVGNVQLGGKDRAEARAILQADVASYKVHLTVGKNGYDLRPSQLGVDYDLETTLNEAFMAGRGHWLPLLGLLDRAALRDNRLAYQVDQTKFNMVVDRIATTNSSVPVDASVVIQDAKPKVVPDQDGQGVEQASLATDIRHAVADGTSSLDIPIQPIKATIQAPDVAISLTAADKIINSHLELHYQNQVFVPTPVQISGWLTFVKSADGKTWETVIDTNRLKGYYLGSVVAKAVNIAATPEKITVVNGQVKDDQPGANGLAVDQDTLASQISAQLPSNPQLSLVVPTTPVAFQKIYNNTIELGLAKYVEVNLSTQHLWAWDNGQVLYDSPVTSGATGAGFATVTGLFSIQAKQTNRNLNGYAIGYNYNVYVQYWMPFYGNYGLHDASWRSSFGGPDYYYGGSHGCINLPLATAAWLFNWVDVGTPVWVHN